MPATPTITATPSPLWARLATETGPARLATRNELIAMHVPLVRTIARRLRHRLPACVDVDDLEQAGTFGLTRAVEHYRPELGYRFSTFAQQRINGSMLDYLRDTAWVPRLARKRGEVGPRWHSMSGVVHDGASRQVSVMDLIDSETAEPGLAMSQRENLLAITKGLPKKHRLICQMYYETGLTMQEISRALGVSESRVSQLHGDALRIMRAQLTRDPGTAARIERLGLTAVTEGVDCSGASDDDGIPIVTPADVERGEQERMAGVLDGTRYLPGAQPAPEQETGRLAMSDEKKTRSTAMRGVMIDDIPYRSINSAAKFLGINCNTLRVRLEKKTPTTVAGRAVAWWGNGDGVGEGSSPAVAANTAETPKTAKPAKPVAESPWSPPAVPVELSSRELAALVVALGDNATADNICDAIDWAKSARAVAGRLESVLKGESSIVIASDELRVVPIAA